MNAFHVFWWILAFVGVALIYVVPWAISLVKKDAISETMLYLMKGIGVVCGAAGILALFVNGGFN